MTQTAAVELPTYADGLFEPHRYKVLFGGRGAGRSWSVARALLIQGAQRPLRILCARELQSSIEASVHQLLTDQIYRMELPYEILKREITHPNGTSFSFEGLKYNTQKIKSSEGVDICWVEEAEHVSDQSWQLIIPTIRKEGSEIWVTFNPDTENDPTYRRFVLNPPPNAWVQKVNWRDNPWLPDTLREEKDYLLRADPDAYAHVWEGECRQATDAQVLKGKWEVCDFEPAEGWDGPYHGADWGFAQDPTTLVRVWINDRTLYIEHEAYKIGLELDATAEHWRNVIPGAEKYTIRADSARPETISYLQRHGLPKLEGVKKWPGSVEDGVSHLRQYERIIIHPRCKHATDEARHWSYKTDARTGDVLPKLADGHEHIWDAVRYALTPMIRRPSRTWIG
jgi:phage terminase large subunit